MTTPTSACGRDMFPATLHATVQPGHALGATLSRVPRGQELIKRHRVEFLCNTLMPSMDAGSKVSVCPNGRRCLATCSSSKHLAHSNPETVLILFPLMCLTVIYGRDGQTPVKGRTWEQWADSQNNMVVSYQSVDERLPAA